MAIDVKGMKAVEIREKAAATFAEARALVEGKDASDISAELEAEFDAKMSEAMEWDTAFTAVAGKDEKFKSLQDKLSFYAGKAGAQIPWDKTQPTSGILPGQAGFHYSGGLMVPNGFKSAGDLFVESEGYQGLLKSGNLKDDNSTVKFETPRVDTKAASDVIGVSTGATGAAALVTPQYLPGILPLPQRPLTVRDLFSQATTNSDLLSYARQTGFDNAAAAVAEATSTALSGLKPQSSIAWTRQTSPIETIATWMAATRRSLADAGVIRSLIDNQLRLMLALEEEDQLINGNGTSPNLRGLENVSGIQTLDLSAETDPLTNLIGIRTAKRLVRTGAARAQADAVVVNPVDSEEFDLLRDGEDRFRAGDPFGVLGATSEAPPIWRLRRVESEAVDAGTAWVGAFRQGATVFEREGITILSSDSHADFFVRNLIAILAEERLGFAVFFPTAFVQITLAAWE